MSLRSLDGAAALLVGPLRNQPARLTSLATTDSSLSCLFITSARAISQTRRVVD